MPEVVKPKSIKALVYTQGRLKLVNVTPKDVGDIELNSVSELMELAESLGVGTVFQVGKEFMFRYLKGFDKVIYYAKQ